MANADPRRLDAQYRTPANLNARAELHRRFGTNPYPWSRWVFDQFSGVPATANLLELGCGPGGLWAANLDRLPSGWDVTLSDRSPGMIQAARDRLGDRFSYQAIDAQAVPLPDASLDAVVANHMLYHVPDRPRAFGEIRRVLKPGGWLFAATNGARHMAELNALLAGFFPPAKGRLARLTRAFSLENAPAQLAPYFTAVRVTRRPGTLVVTAADPLVDYVYSLVASLPGTLRGVAAAARPRFARYVQRRLDRDGAIRITQDAGVVSARVPGGE